MTGLEIETRYERGVEGEKIGVGKIVLIREKSD